VTSIRPRPVAGWFGMILQLLASVAFLLGLSRTVGWPWALLAVALGGLLIRVTHRSKGPTAEGATWSAGADLLMQRHKFPGQLSLTSEELIWIPSRYSERKGVVAVRVPLATSMINLSAGSALLDVIVRITADGGGKPLRFLTHRSARLREAASKLGN
jgi:hypothetical protein